MGLLRGPIRVVTFVILLHLGLMVFSWPSWLQQFLSRGLLIVVAVSLTYLALKVVDLFMGYWKTHAAPDADPTIHQQLFPILRRSLQIFVVIVAVLVTSQNLGFNITGLIASLSIGGLALGLAAQDTLSNLFGRWRDRWTNRSALGIGFSWRAWTAWWRASGFAARGFGIWMGTW